MTVEIVILAMIAAFLGLRLYSVLGRRAEHEEESVPGRFDPNAKAGTMAPSPQAAPQADRNGAGVQPRVASLPSVSPLVDRELRAIAAADRRFDAMQFLAGAREAYRMVLEAFWRGDKDELRALCDADVFEGFASAIDARAQAGEVLDNRLVRIEESTIIGAAYEAPMARVTIRFRSDIAAVTRNAEGKVVAGSLDDAVDATDIWTFARDVNSSDPDWLLVETDEG